MPERKVVLASASPRRQRLLRRLGLQFSVEAAAIDEQAIRGGSPEELVARIALAKAEAVHRPGQVTVAADTTVALDDEILGKPRSAEEATTMLKRLRGRWHRVLTALAVVDDRGAHVDVVTTEVLMRPYSDEEIAAYVASGDPFDKAGAYAVQNRQFHPVERIRGCYENVVGLPLCQLQRRLKAAGVAVPGLPPDICRQEMGQECEVAQALEA